MATLFFALSLACCESLPHILWLVADDLGWDDVGFRSHQIRTPNIDLLAGQGIVLDQYYVQSVCSPTRATFLTGRYPLHNTVNDWLEDGDATALPLNETLLPQLLKEAGYATHAVGKWHLGFYKWAHTPTFRGFDSFFGFYTGGEQYFSHEASQKYDFRRDPNPQCGKGCSQVAWKEKGTYSTHVFAAEAIRIIQNHSASVPLFLYLAWQAVHSPSEVPDSYVTPYEKLIKDNQRRTFAGMLSCMDEGIGNVTAALRAKNMLDSTLIIFTTDNGGPTADTPTDDFVGSSNWPLRGGKHTIWEGGTRGVAALWIGDNTGLPPFTRPSYDNMMHGADWFPTLCDLAGVSYKKLSLDGVSQLQALFHNGSAPRTEFVYGRNDYSPQRYIPYDDALRKNQWKLIQGWGGIPDTWLAPANLSSPRSSPAACPLQNNSCYAPRFHFREIPNSNAQACCESCQGEAQCVGWSLIIENQTCFLASNLMGGAAGTCLSGTTVTKMLFDLVSDPEERNDVSASYPEIVAEMSTTLDAYRATEINFPGGGGIPDRDCPPYPPTNESHVGPIWQPWCG